MTEATRRWRERNQRRAEDAAGLPRSGAYSQPPSGSPLGGSPPGPLSAGSKTASAGVETVDASRAAEGRGYRPVESRESSEPARSLNPRSVIARLQKLKELLYVPRNRYYLAEKLEVTTKTIDRDLEFARDTLGWKLHVSIDETQTHFYHLASEPVPVL